MTRPRRPQRVAARLGLPPTAGRGGLLAAMAIDSLGTGLFLPFALLYFLHTTSLSLTAIGTALTLAGLIALPTPAVLASLVDRWPPKTVVAVGNLVSAVALTSYLFVHSQLALVGAAVATNVGQRTFWTATRALIGEIAAPAERPGWFALQSTILNAGYGTGALMGAAAVSTGTRLGFHVLAAADAASYVAAAALLFRFRPSPRSDPRTLSPQARPASGPPPPAPRYAQVLADRRLWAVTGVNLVFVLAESVLSVLLMIYVIQVLREPAFLGGLLLTLNTVIIVAGQTSITAAFRRRPPRRLLQAAALAFALSFTVLWAITDAPRGLVVPALVVMIVLFTLAEILESPTVNTLAVGLAPSHAPGRHLGFFQLSWSVGTAAAPFLLTHLLAIGPSWPPITLIALCTLTIVLLGPTGPGHTGLPSPYISGQDTPAYSRLTSPARTHRLTLALHLRPGHTG
jgi:predicted MFS family arabinose efflux permease